MPIIKSAKKSIRQSKKRNVRNLKQKKEIKSVIKKVVNLTLEKKPEEAKKLLPRVYKLLDKGVKTKLIKKNSAARKKSRITKFIARTTK